MRALRTHGSAERERSLCTNETNETNTPYVRPSCRYWSSSFRRRRVCIRCESRECASRSVRRRRRRRKLCTACVPRQHDVAVQDHQGHERHPETRQRQKVSGGRFLRGPFRFSDLYRYNSLGRREGPVASRVVRSRSLGWVKAKGRSELTSVITFKIWQNKKTKNR